MPLLCCNYTPHTCKTFVQHAQLAPQCSLIRSVLALDTLACQTTLLVSAAKEGNAVSLGRALGRIRKRQGMVLVSETCEYHSRGEEYMVLFGETCG